MLWQKDYIATRKIAGGVVIAAERVTYPVERENPGAPLFHARNAVWEMLERVAGVTDAFELDDGLVGELYGVICHLDALVMRIDGRFAMEARVREKTEPHMHLRND